MTYAPEYGETLKTIEARCMACDWTNFAYSHTTRRSSVDAVRAVARRHTRLTHHPVRVTYTRKNTYRPEAR